MVLAGLRTCSDVPTPPDTDTLILVLSLSWTWREVQGKGKEDEDETGVRRAVVFIGTSGIGEESST